MENPSESEIIEPGDIPEWHIELVEAAIKSVEDGTVVLFDWELIKDSFKLK